MIGGPRPAQERAFHQSVIYASLFDYPLTLEQLRESLIGEVADEATLAEWYRRSPRLQSAIEQSDGYFFPRGQAGLLRTRHSREARSRRLLEAHAWVLWLVTHIPFVRMVALSGSLAHLNADAEADLDLFVVTTPRRVWSVTLTTLLLTRLLGCRRQLCLNYVVSERALMVGPADLFSANQIVHLQPLTGGEVYRRFIDENRFVERFYPNFRPRPVVGAGTARVNRVVRAIEIATDWTIAPLYERVSRLVYRWHLRRRSHTWRSRDQVRLEAECLKLHTHSHRHEVMEQFERALEHAAAGFTPQFTCVDHPSGRTPGRLAPDSTEYCADGRSTQVDCGVKAEESSPVRAAR
jgi:hypothetical protein